MSPAFDCESTLTDRYQTTVPEMIRRALGLGKRDRLRYSISASGEVVLSRVDPAEEEDEVLGQFLEFLAADIKAHPERIEAVDLRLVKRLKSLVKDIELDLDQPLSAEDE